MIFKLLLLYVFCINYFCVVGMSTTRKDKRVLCVSSEKDSQNEIPIILNPPIYKYRTTIKENLVLKQDFCDWKTLNSRNLPLGPVLDKRWEDFPVEKDNVLTFKSIRDVIPFSVCIYGTLDITVIYMYNGSVFYDIIFHKSFKRLEDRNCEWEHYFIETENMNIMLYDENFENISNKTMDHHILSIQATTSELSFWKRHLYDFQQIQPKDSYLIENYDLGTVSEQENLCVSIYVAVTRGLSLKIRLNSGVISDEKIVNYISNPSSSISWQNVKLNITSSSTANISIEATSEILNLNPFWLIDLKNVKFCSNKYDKQLFIVSWETQEKYSCVRIYNKKLKKWFEEFENLKIENKQNTILLSWDIPDAIFNVVEYVVMYQMVDKLSCKHYNQTRRTELHSVSVNGNETSVQLTNLEYFARYSLNVSIITDKENITITKNATTGTSLEIEEIIKNLTFTENKFINLMFEDCNHFNGPLNITLSLKCLDKWCSNATENDTLNIDFEDFQKNTKSTKIKLQTFTSYQPEIEISRLNKTRNKIFPIIRTNPGEPGPVVNLTVEHTSRELFLKWKAPYPPTGIVSYYIIKYADDRGLFNQFNISSDSYCSISQEFLCANISNLKQNTGYFIKIFLKNQNIEKIDSSMSVIFLGQKAFQPPYNLTLKWNNLTRKFQLSWDYDYFSNSSFHSFYIRKIDEKENKEEHESLNNTLELDLENFVFYNISVRGQNKYFSSEESTINVKIFPHLQDLKNDFPIIEQCLNSSCTLTVFDSQKERVLKKYNTKHSEIDDRSVKCLTRPKKWKVLNEIAIEKNYYSRINFGGGTGIIFNLDNEIFCISTNVVMNSKSSTGIIIIITAILSLMIFMLLLLCSYFVYRFYANNNQNNILKDEHEPLTDVCFTNSNSKLIETEDLKEYINNCFKNNSSEIEVVKQHSSQDQEKRANDNYKTENALPFFSIDLNAYDISESPMLIVARCPDYNKIQDFWEMIYEKDVSAVVSIENIRENHYSPKEFSCLQFEGISINNKTTKYYKDHINRTLEITFMDKIKLVNHFQFFSFQKETILANFQYVNLFLKEILRIFDNNSTALIQQNVNCDISALIISCATALKMEGSTGNVDFLKIFFDIKEKGEGMTLTVEEYLFGHLFVLEHFQSEKYSLKINQEFQILLNRFLNDIPLNTFIKDLDEMKELQKLIDNSEFVDNDIEKSDCFSFYQKYICVQQPSNDLHEDCWSFVWDFDIYLIVSLNEIEGRDPDVSIFWPNKKSEIIKSRELSIECLKVQDNHYLQTFKLKITSNKEEESESKIINLISMKQWRARKHKPYYIQSLLFTWKEMMDKSSFSTEKNILLACYDGFTACGLFLACTFLLEKIISERIFDSYTAIRKARQYDERFVRDFRQIEMLHKFALEYICKFEEANYSYTTYDEARRKIIYRK